MLVAKQKGVIMFLAMLTTVLLTSVSLAAEGSKPTVVTLQGYVSVIRDANDVVISVQLVTNEDTYDVVLDAKGLELGEKMEDEEVEVKGTVSQKDDQKWLTVLTFKAIEE